MYTFEQLKCAGHCRALGCLRGWLLPSLPQWKSRHLPFLHQKMCWQVTYVFYIWKCADRSLLFSTLYENVQVTVQLTTRELLCCAETFQLSFKQLVDLFEEKPFLHTSHSLPVSLTSKGRFLPIPPQKRALKPKPKPKERLWNLNLNQKGGSEPWQVCRDGSFPRCPFGSRTICPFRIRKCADRFQQQHWKKHTNCVFTTRSEPRRQCTVGMPHCPWFTKNRNNPWNPTEEKFNRGPNRPQNKAWSAKDL